MGVFVLRSNCPTNRGMRGRCPKGVVVLVGNWQRGSCPMGVIVLRSLNWPRMEGKLEVLPLPSIFSR